MSPARPGRRPPNPREMNQSPLVSEKLKFLWRNSDAGTQAAAGGERPAFRSDDVHGARQRRAVAGHTAAPPSPLRRHGAL
jgi:hypothetical protein